MAITMIMMSSASTAAIRARERRYRTLECLVDLGSECSSALSIMDAEEVFRLGEATFSRFDEFDGVPDHLRTLLFDQSREYYDLTVRVARRVKDLYRAVKPTPGDGLIPHVANKGLDLIASLVDRHAGLIEARVGTSSSCYGLDLGIYDYKTHLLQQIDSIAQLTIEMTVDEEYLGEEEVSGMFRWLSYGDIGKKAELLRKHYVGRSKIDYIGKILELAAPWDKDKFVADKMDQVLLYTPGHSMETIGLVLQTYLLIDKKYEQQTVEKQCLLLAAEEMLKADSSKEDVLRAHFRVAHDWIEREGYVPAMTFMRSVTEEKQKV